MSSNTITHWCGRFGNNIQQISNAIYFCKKNNLHFKCPENEWINSFEINFGHTKEKITVQGRYFFYSISETGQGGPDFYCDKDDLNKSRKDICENYIYPNLKIQKNNLIFDKNIAILHIRSGDIFSRKNYYCPVVSRYLQNPFSFYNYISQHFAKIVCIYENGDNPLLQHISDIKNVDMINCNFEDTVSMMLSARNIITSGVSTFSIAAALLSTNIQNLYATNIFLEEHLNPTMLCGKVSTKIFNINTEKYIKVGNWLNNHEQRNKMIEYTQDYE